MLEQRSTKCLSSTAELRRFDCASILILENLRLFPPLTSSLFSPLLTLKSLSYSYIPSTGTLGLPLPTNLIESLSEDRHVRLVVQEVLQKGQAVAPTT